MASESKDIVTTVKRLITSLFIHVVIGAAIVGIVFWLTSHFEDASVSLRNSYAGDPSSSASVMTLLEDARSHLVTWAVACLVVSLVVSGLFLSLAQRRRPNNVREGRSGRLYWGLLGAALLAAVWGLFWFYVSRAEVGASLMFGNLLGIVATGVFGSVLAYYMATALTVTLTMKPSVPLAGFLPNMWN